MAKLYGNQAADFAATNLMSFGKSFSRLNGQPLDKSEIWYNDFAALEAYALTDAAYVGQKVAFIETITDDSGAVTGGSVTHYSIEIDGSLKNLGTEALAGNIESILAILNGGESGEQGLIARVTSLETNTYTKEQTDERIAEKIAAADHLKREIVDVLPAVDSADLNTIYMVPAHDPEDNDAYDEYMVFEVDGGVDSEGIELPDTKKYEKVGSWGVDLSGYVTKTELENTNDVIDVLEEDLAEEIERAKAAEEANATAASNAQATANTASTNATLALNKITELTTVVNGKVDQVYSNVPVIDPESGSTAVTAEDFASGEYFIKTAAGGYVKADTYVAGTTYYTQVKDSESGDPVFTQVAHTLLTPDDKAKLDKLVFDDDGGVSVSGNINISQVQGLDGYLTETHFAPSVVNKLNYITSVDSNFVVEDSTLKLNSAIGRLLTADEADKIAKAANGDYNFIKTVNQGEFKVTNGNLSLGDVPVASLTTALGNLSSLETDVVTSITNINERLTWVEMAE